MDLFLFIYGVIAVILLTVLMGVLVAASLGLKWYRRYRNARRPAPKGTSRDFVSPV